jgi:hypothetical protein
MTIETAVNTLLEQQESILAIFTANSTSWDSKLDLSGGTIVGNVIFQNFGLFDLSNKIANFSATITLTSPLQNTDAVININSNVSGGAILNMGINNNNAHNAQINLGATSSSLLTIARTSTGSSLITHTGTSDLTISASAAADIIFKVNGGAKFKILANGDTETYQSHTIYTNLYLTSTGLIGQTDSSHSLILSGGHDLVNGNAHITINSGLSSNNAGGIDFYVNGSSIVPALSITNTSLLKFNNSTQAPIINLTGGIITTGQLPQLNFNDTTQSLNNKKWQIMSSNSNLLIQALDDAGNPGTDIVKFIRSSGTNTLSGASFGSDYEIFLDTVTPAIKINNIAVVNARRTGWTNTGSIANVSRDMSLINADSTSIGKVLKALISDLLTHGLIGA